jgi:hypothetical protein
MGFLKVTLVRETKKTISSALFKNGEQKTKTKCNTIVH